MIEMDKVLKADLDDISAILEEIKKSSVDYLNGLDQEPTSQTDQQVDFRGLAETGMGSRKTLEFFNQEFKKLIVASAGPRYWGYVVGGVTPAALAGDWLTPVFDQNTQNIQGNGDVSAIIELQTIRLIRELMELPDVFNGGFVTGATMSNFTGLAVGRQWAGAQINRDMAGEGMQGGIIVMATAPHSSVIKSLSMLGFGSNNIVRVACLEGREAIDLEDLEQNLVRYQGKPVLVSCSGGTVNTVDFDDLAGIAALKKKYPFWMHVDAAFGGFAACTEGYKDLLQGWEFADSITIDCHKWMNVPYDSAVFFVRKEHRNLQVRTFRNSNAPYLGDPEENFSFLNFLPENSRRFRALPAWFSLMAYGRAGFRSIVENSIDCAKSFASYLNERAFFELSAPVRMNVVCFSLKNKAQTAEFLDQLNARKKVFMTPTLLEGQLCIRAAFVNFRTSEEDISIAIEEMEAVLESLSVSG
jgi:glutamate/tyrosine decarboxylase-like PLP-dependent enzyme